MFDCGLTIFFKTDLQLRREKLWVLHYWPWWYIWRVDFLIFSIKIFVNIHLGPFNVINGKPQSKASCYDIVNTFCLVYSYTLMTWIDKLDPTIKSSKVYYISNQLLQWSIRLGSKAYAPFDHMHICAPLDQRFVYLLFAQLSWDISHEFCIPLFRDKFQLCHCFSLWSAHTKWYISLLGNFIDVCMKQKYPGAKTYVRKVDKIWC